MYRSKSIIIIVILILFISLINFPIHSNSVDEFRNDSSYKTAENFINDESENQPVTRSLRTRNGLIKNSVYGGSWVDKFVNQDHIESTTNVVLHNYRSDSSSIILGNNGGTFYSTGNLQSKPITLPPDMTWDSLFINKTESLGGTITLSILNANNDQVIFSTSSSDNEINLRDNVNSQQYISIKLKASFTSNGTYSPKLHNWGVSWNASYAWRDDFFGSLKVDSASVLYDEGDSFLPTNITQWYKYSGNPILSPTSATWDSSHVQLPTVIFNGTGYWMWYDGRSGSSWAIGLATSPDGMTWTKYSGNPVLTRGSGWEGRYISTPVVLYDGNSYKMWYRGMSNSNSDWQTGLATSNDGINWAKYVSNPVLPIGGSSAWDHHYAMMSCVYYDGLVYKGWYNGLAQINPPTVAPYQIGYATSTNGISWNKYVNNPVISAPPRWYYGKGSMVVFPTESQYLGWFGYSDSSIRSQNYTTSNDGLKWVDYPFNPIITRGPSGAWDDSGLSFISIIYKDKQYYMYYSGNDGSVSRIGLAKSKFKTNGELKSKKISLPTNIKYNKLLINKTEPSGTSIKISILNGNTGNPITYFKDLSGTEIDISSISPSQYPTIILKADFNSNSYNTPFLHDWSIVHDFTPRIDNITSALILNRTHTTKIKINLTDREEPEDKLTLLVDYKKPGDTQWSTEYLTDLYYNIDHWECIFTPPTTAKLGFYEFRFTYNDSFSNIGIHPVPYLIKVVNNLPIIEDITYSPPNDYVKRTETLKIIINASDIEILENNLIIGIKYRHVLDTKWEIVNNLEILFELTNWEYDFSPSKNMKAGLYIFNISCNDSDGEVYQEINITVLNNIPGKPILEILPPEPNTMDELNVKVLAAPDIETTFNRMTFWYRWFKDNSPMLEYDNSTTIPYTETVKDQTWRCIVYPFDGDHVGPTGEAQTRILNSPPECVEEFDSYQLMEDTFVVLKDKLSTIFSDVDNDSLEFSVKGYNKIKVEITQDNGTLKLEPPENWFGTEEMTFYANDSFSKAAEETVVVTINPLNDLPTFNQIGNQYISASSDVLQFIVKQDNWLNLTIVVEDIDGDVDRGMIQYILNITQTNDFFFREHDNSLIFHPKNDDVGWHYINITITDNNETPTEYVWQHIKIRVLNVNDPPTVEIITPENGLVVSKSDVISFKCVAQDIDLSVWNSVEKLRYLWYTNKTELGNLGTNCDLTNISLPPGFYNFTVKVEDSYGAKAYDHVHISVKDVPKDKPKTTEIYTLYLWLGLLLILLIIIVCLLLFIFTRKKKKRMEEMGIPAQQVLQPDAAYLPQVPSIAPEAQLPQPQVISAEPMPAAPAQAPLGTTPTIAQLPAAAAPTPTVEEQSDVIIYEQKSGIDSRLTPLQKLDLLEQRLLQGGIDQDIYLNLKAKYEMEAQPYTPPPQLPPPSFTPSPEPATMPASEPTQVPTQTPTVPSVEAPPVTIEPTPELPQEIETPQIAPEPSLPSDLPADAFQQPAVQPQQPEIQLQQPPSAPPQQQPPKPPQQQVPIPKLAPEQPPQSSQTRPQAQPTTQQIQLPPQPESQQTTQPKVQSPQPQKAKKEKSDEPKQ